MLIKILIIFFTCLLGYQLFLALFNKGNLVEGLENEKKNNEYKDYNTDDPNNPNSALILSQQNAGNIEVLNGRVTKLDGLNDRVTTAESSIESMQTQIDALVQQQADFANDLTGPAPEVTGLDEETTADAEADAEEDE
jgi:hypothetical protein